MIEVGIATAAISVERQLRMCVAFVERELERLRLRERVDVVTHGIAVRELHQRAGADEEHVRHNLIVLLIHAGRTFRSAWFLDGSYSHGRRVHSYLRDRFTALIADLDFKRAGEARERDSDGDQRCRRDQGGHPRQSVCAHANHPRNHEIRC